MTIVDHASDDKLKRKPVMASLGVNYHNACFPHPDPECKDTMKAGVLKRFVSQPPTPNPIKLRKLKRFVRRWVRKNLTPLASTSDVSVESWLASTNYPLWRKQQLLKKWNKIGGKLERKHYAVKSFMKMETYPEFKHARAINSRTDEFKCAVGPIFKLIEKEVFSLPYFIKKIPMRDRPSYIRQRLYRDGKIYYATDYTAYESHFTKEMMETIEFELYDYMTQYLPDHDKFMGLMKNVLAGWNMCHFRDFTVKVRAKRMSGEMCTSLGNGFSNLMCLLFLCEENGCTDIACVIEGDDGLYTGEGNLPTEQDFLEIGFTIKMERHENLNTASFCGLIFDEQDELNITDPIAEIISFGWTKSEYVRSKDIKLKQLLRSKALSLAYQYPGCPIVQNLAFYGLRVTTGIKINKNMETNMWHYDQLTEAMEYYKIHGIAPVQIPMRTRLLMQSVYGISLYVQREIEKYFDSLTEIQVLRHSLIDMFTSRYAKDYFYTYCSPMDIKSTSLNFPIQTFK